jgi:8-oxo-dGTP pyrophosphatase MutT (NUDIX family)
MGAQGGDESGAGGAGRRRRRRRRRRGTPTGSSGTAAPAAGAGGTPETTSDASTPPAPVPKKAAVKKRGGRRGRPQAKPTAAGKAQPTGRKQPVAKKKTPGKGPVHKEVSAGGVVYRRADDGIEIVLASRRTRRGELAWGLAKGGIEEGESHEEAAVREVQEETGLTAEIEASLGETKYFYVWEETRIRKTVHFFLMRHTGGDPADHDDEMEEIRWFPLERAMKRAAYRGEREVIGRAAELLR